jgi:hypothetical protein
MGSQLCGVIRELSVSYHVDQSHYLHPHPYYDVSVTHLDHHVPKIDYHVPDCWQRGRHRGCALPGGGRLVDWCALVYFSGGGALDCQTLSTVARAPLPTSVPSTPAKNNTQLDTRAILTEIYLDNVCSGQEIVNSTRTHAQSDTRARARRVSCPPAT